MQFRHLTNFRIKNVNSQGSFLCFAKNKHPTKNDRQMGICPDAPKVAVRLKTFSELQLGAGSRQFVCCGKLLSVLGSGDCSKFLFSYDIL